MAIREPAAIAGRRLGRARQTGRRHSTQPVAPEAHLQRQKAGHAGTLDPLASGILPSPSARRPKTVPLRRDGEKAYPLHRCAGGSKRTPTIPTASPCSIPDLRPKRRPIAQLLPQFVGTICSVRRQFSAIKVAGERA